MRVTGIRKSFGGAGALHGVDLDVRDGELMALLGPSGSGKTTLLRVIAGLDIPDEGRVFFGTDDVTDDPVQGRRIGFVFQHYALFKHLTVFDNIAFGPRVAKTGRQSAAALQARVHDLLALVQLDGLGGRFPTQLSGGQRQRVALARALAAAPRVLLLDEPFGALDARVRKDLRRWLREIHRETGQTTIFVTHDQDEAMELADRVAILNAGRIEQVATPDELHDRPASAFVMSFVGESTRIPIQVSRGLSYLRERPIGLQGSPLPDGDATLFVRPWDVRIVEPDEGILNGVVDVVRRSAGVRRAVIRAVGVDALIEVELAAGLRLTSGDTVGLAITGGEIFGSGI